MEETFDSDKRKLSYELKIAKISSVKFLWSHLEDLNLFCEVWEILNGTPSQRKSSAARPRIRMKILQSLLEWKINAKRIKYCQCEYGDNMTRKSFKKSTHVGILTDIALGKKISLSWGPSFCAFSPICGITVWLRSQKIFSNEFL